MKHFILEFPAKYQQLPISWEINELMFNESKFLVNYLNYEVARGQKFKPGQTVQVGWMVVVLKSIDKHNLEIWEPDFDSFPIRWIKGLNNTLRHLFLQRGVCEQLGCAFNFPSILQSSVVSGEWAEARELEMSRDEENGNDSGWVIYEPNQFGDHNDSQLISLYEASLLKPLIIPFLALPSNSHVRMKDGLLIVRHKEMEVVSSNNEYLQSIALNEFPV